MIRTLAIFALSLLSGCAVEAPPTKGEVIIRANVQDVVMLADFSGTATPVTFDPRFALTIRIESCRPAITNFAAGSLITFAIHSPSLLFGAEDAKGKTYDLALHRQIQHGKVRYSGLEIRTK